MVSISTDAGFEFGIGFLFWGLGKDGPDFLAVIGMVLLACLYLVCFVLATMQPDSFLNINVF